MAKRRQAKRDHSESRLYVERTREGRFECYDAADGIRWRLVANNGKTVCDSAEAYTEYRGAIRGASRSRKILGALSDKVPGK